jgi:hypothetical protein
MIDARPFVAVAVILGLGGTSRTALAQQEEKAWKYPGSLELTGRLYGDRPHPADTRALLDLRGQIGIQGPIRRWLSVHGRWDLRADTHTDVDEGRWLDVDQRGLRPAAGTLDELYLDLELRHVDVRLGTQEIRWGRADGFNPTDNINPIDYADPFSPRRLGVPAIRVDADFGRTGVQGVWVPFFAPTRLPLLGKRWFPALPRTALAPLGPSGEEIPVDVTYREGTRVFPARTLGNGQWGVRWNQLLPRGEFSLSYLYAFNDIGFYRTATGVELGGPAPELVLVLNREYHRVGILGFDFASELGPVGIRGEMALRNETDPDNLDRFVYIVGLDRRWKDWLLVVQYTDRAGGDTAGSTPVFPDLGLRSTLLSHIERTLGPTQSLELRSAFRLRDGDFLLQLRYSRALTDRWRLELGGALFGGPRAGYLGQYRGNDDLTFRLRYAF